MKHSSPITQISSSANRALPSNRLVVRAQQPAPSSKPSGCQQQQHNEPASGINRRSAFLQLTSTALLGSVGLVLGSQGLLSPAQPAWAAGEPRELTGAVKAAVDKALDKYVVKSKGPVLLRLAYHDAATYSVKDGKGGANASVQYEFDRPENTGLKRGWNVIQQIAQALEGSPAAGQVSKADLIALAGAKAVAVCGGPSISMLVGREDAAAADPTGRMVSEKAGVEALKGNFADKGLGVKEMVVLSGAHTLGGKGFGDPVTFDNAYYTSLQNKPWLNPNDSMAEMIGLPSDHVLPDDPECRVFIDAYAADQQLFFQDFTVAYQQLTSLGAVWV